MTGTRVLTALVLIPIVLAVVLLTPTAVVTLAVAFITILALREYFALGDAIGHRAYRLWTIFSALLLLFLQFRLALRDTGMPGDAIFQFDAVDENRGIAMFLL